MVIESQTSVPIEINCNFTMFKPLSEPYNGIGETYLFIFHISGHFEKEVSISPTSEAKTPERCHKELFHI